MLTSAARVKVSSVPTRPEVSSPKLKALMAVPGGFWSCSSPRPAPCSSRLATPPEPAVTLTVASRSPASVGRKNTVIEHCPPAARGGPQVLLPGTMPKSPGWLPWITVASMPVEVMPVLRRNTWVPGIDSVPTGSALKPEQGEVGPGGLLEGDRGRHGPGRAQGRGDRPARVGAHPQIGAEVADVGGHEAHRRRAGLPRGEDLVLAAVRADHELARAGASAGPRRCRSRPG